MMTICPKICPNGHLVCILYAQVYFTDRFYISSSTGPFDFKLGQNASSDERNWLKKFGNDSDIFRTISAKKCPKMSESTPNFSCEFLLMVEVFCEKSLETIRTFSDENRFLSEIWPKSVRINSKLFLWVSFNGRSILWKFQVNRPSRTRDMDLVCKIQTSV